MKKRTNKTRIISMLLTLLLVISVFLYALNRIGMFKRGQYGDEILTASVFFNIDPLLIEAVMKRESNMNPNAVSAKGAVGLMQIMPKTALEISEQVFYSDYSEERLSDPEINIMFGAYYLAKLLEYYNYNLILALAAYNAGIGNVDKWREQTPEIAVKISKIPFKETKKHVRAIIITYNFYKGAEQLKRLQLLKTKKK
ncbi:MAG: lytic transglycosylase domain-containing protein [Endomicrobia bacterium]|nr:lytic transglycosylase domain-containing protein [Endomicrobiia bacterium]